MPRCALNGPVQRLRGFIRDCSGTAATEFAVFAAVLVPIFLVAVDLGFAIRERMLVNHMVRLASQEAMRPGTERADIQRVLEQAIAAHAGPRLMAPRATVSEEECFCRPTPGTIISCETSCVGTDQGVFHDISIEARYRSLFAGNLLTGALAGLPASLRIEVLRGVER